MDINKIFDEQLRVTENISNASQETNVKAKKLDIFNVLNQTDKQNYGFFDSLSEDAIKEFSPWVVQRWLANKKLELVNEITNPLISHVSKKLAYRLFCVIGMGSTTRYRWDTPPKKISGNDTITSLVANHYDVSTKVAKTYLVNLSSEDILEIALGENADKKTMTKIKRGL